MTGRLPKAIAIAILHGTLAVYLRPLYHRLTQLLKEAKL